MEFFHSVNIDWMGKAKYFVSLSLFLLLIGASSIFLHGGMRYGIDFRGGTLVYVRFASPPPLDQIRSSLSQQGISNSTLQGISDISDPNTRNDVVIGLEEKGEGEQALDAGRQAIVGALEQTFGTFSAGKQDFNSITPSSLATFLIQRDPLGLGLAAQQRYQQLAQQLTDLRDKNFNGILRSFDQFSAPGTGVDNRVLAALKDGFSLGNFTIRNVEIVGPKVGAQLRRQAFWATMYALGGMLVYIAIRFEWVYGAAAVIAVFHDVLITLGFFSLFKYEISLTVIAALLTLVGYSMNDTIVIFDRVRENLRLMRRDAFPDIVNRSINQTLSRTILTSGLTFITVLVLYLMGGSVLRAFSFAMVIGVVVGTYSSFGIAAPIVVVWYKYHGRSAMAGSGTAAAKRLA
ncbi:MAG: protein translocase subunit SecF [Candidatus Acidiferrales bacterium]